MAIRNTEWFPALLMLSSRFVAAFSTGVPARRESALTCRRRTVHSKSTTASRVSDQHRRVRGEIGTNDLQESGRTWRGRRRAAPGAAVDRCRRHPGNGTRRPSGGACQTHAEALRDSEFHGDFFGGAGKSLLDVELESEAEMLDVVLKRVRALVSSAAKRDLLSNVRADAEGISPLKAEGRTLGSLSPQRLVHSCKARSHEPVRLWSD